MGEAFVALAGGEEEDGGLRGLGEGGEEFFAPEGPDFGRSENESVAGCLDFARDLPEKIAADVDGVIGGGGFDLDGAHAKTSVQRSALRLHRTMEGNFHPRLMWEGEGFGDNRRCVF